MSASNKKKLRHAEKAAKMTERQIQAQAEAKKLNLYTTLFVAVLAVLLVAAVTIGAIKTIQGSGIRERSTTALTVGNHEISNAELSYYYVDAINSFLNDYGSYAYLFGLDTTKPLNEQFVDEENGITWADDFLTSAKGNIRSVYTMLDAAAEAGYTLPAESEAQIDTALQNLEAYALLYGYGDAETYIKAMYGKGSTLESYKEYCCNTVLADAFRTNYAASLTYEDADLRAHEEGHYNAFSSYSYNYYYLATSRFLEGGTTDENGNTTYSDAEKAASVEAAEAAAKTLTADTINSVESLETALNRLSINEGTEATTIACDDYLSTSILSVAYDWIIDDARQEGDLTYFPSTSTSTDADGNEVVTTSGYYVVFYRGCNDNKFPVINARHILVGFEGGLYDESTGVTTYSDEEKQAAWTKAEELLAQWKEGEATEDSFAALANENSDDTGSNTVGGLYTNIYPGQMVEPFETWCYDEHEAGDTGLVETTYGVHIMYYVGESDTTYRDLMITAELISNATTEWYNALLEGTTVVEVDTQYINKGLIISAG